jgi:hypothetical protein
MTTQVIEAETTSLRREVPGSAPAKPIPAARIRDEIADAIKALVAKGRIRPGDRDANVRHKVGDYMEACGSNSPSERSFRRYLPQLRPLWRMPR